MMLMPSREQILIQRRDRAFGAGAPLFYDQPIEVVRGEGVFLFDVEGRRYVDMYNNVPCVGHCHPKVVEAVTRQAATLNVHSRYLNESAIAFAERLTALHGPQIESVLFSCTGTEANEVALRMARFATGRQGVVCTNATYHGNSELVGSLTHVGRARPETDTVHAFPFPETYRPIRPGLDEARLCDAYLEALEDAIRRFEASGVGFAALIVCSIFANEGLPDVPRGFMAKARDLAHAAGGLVIADEVQAGYGRTGQWWGYDAAGFVPDIVVTGKPMGNGVPLAATAASRSLIETFRSRTRYFNTFAASPLQAAAGMAVLDVIEEDGLLKRVAKVGADLKAALAGRKRASPIIGDVRGKGLFIGVEIVQPDGSVPDQDRAASICNRLKDKGFLTSSAGVFRNVVKIRPPLVFGSEQALEFLQAWDATMADLRV
jgi:4-aminobutyrate aminotransferase-like enzyme